MRAPDDHPGERPRAAVPLRSCAASGKSKPVRLAMAGAVHDRGRRRAHPRQDARTPGKQPLPRPVVQRGGRSDARPAAGRGNPLDRSDAGEERLASSLRSVQRILEAHGLEPHRVRTFKLSNDPKFAAKLKDIVGLYVDPPAHAVVLSVDEKSQIQALDRTQPGLPMKPGRAGTMTHDYKRHGTTTRCSRLSTSSTALSSAATCSATAIRSSSASSIPIEARVAREAEIRSTSSTTTPPTSTRGPRRWLDRHSRWTFHFTPTSAPGSTRSKASSPSCTRAASEARRLPIRRRPAGSPSTASWPRPTPIRSPSSWTADPERVIAAVKRGKQVLKSIH